MLNEVLRAEIVGSIPHLQTYARSLTRSTVAADDLVQDTLERAWRYQTTFIPGASLKAWLFGIMRNRFIDQIRERRRASVYQDTESDAQFVTPPDQIWRLQYADLVNAIHRLAPATRDAVILVMLCGLSHEDAANVLDCPIGTLKSRIRRARPQLITIVEVESLPCLGDEKHY